MPFKKIYFVVVLLTFILFAVLHTTLKFKNRSKLNCNSSKTTVKIKKEFRSIFNLPEKNISEIYSHLSIGGIRKKSEKYQYVAIIVPYRDRPIHLTIFLRHIHSFLHKQPINYGIFIVEQIQNQTFNRAKLMNVGFLESLKNGPWNCFFFHDVDLLPENLLNFYKCKKRPTHFSAAINKLNYTVPYYSYFGGVTAMFRHNFEKLNGFSNEFWGWGYEDDELRKRLLSTGSKFYRLPKVVGRYTTISHKRDKGNPENPKNCRIHFLNHTGSRFHKDGLNTINYTIQKITKEKLYVHLLVDLLEKKGKHPNKKSCLF